MLKVLSLFSGIGAFERALENIGIDFKVVNYCEIDRYASKAYSLLHKIDESFNIGDITKVDPDSIKEDIDLITWGFPCTDISISGYQKGFTDQNGKLTRSGLFYEGMRIINAKKPKIAICENVKNLTGNRFKEEFKTVLSSLEEAGYNNYWKILNAKDFGVPQNRERVFIISIRKDVDKGGHYEFPEGFPLTLRLKDVLEKDVDEKYYIPDELVQRIKFLDDNYSNLNDTSKLIKIGNTNPSGKGMNGNVYLEDGLPPTITTNKGEGPRIAVRQIGNCMPTKKRDNPNQGRIYDINGLSPTLTTAQGGGRQPFILLPESKCTAAAMRGRYKEDGSMYQNIEISNREYANTITTVQKDSMIYNGFRIRKLTPTECFVLMGFNKEDAELLISNKISNTQLYKQSGNSIVVNVLEYIFIELKKHYPNIFI